MRNLKKALALVLALMMALSLMSFASASDYADAGSVTKDEAVDVMSAINVFQGTDGGNFDPTGELTRAQAAKIISYMKLGADGAESLPKDEAPFGDVKAERWYTGYVAYAKAEGIINGRSEEVFDPNGKVTGYEFGKMVLEAAGIKGEYSGTAAWTINVTINLRSNGLLAGIEDIALSKNITREQACQMAFNGLIYAPAGATTGKWIVNDIEAGSHKPSIPSSVKFDSYADAIQTVKNLKASAVLGTDFTVVAEKDMSGSLAATVFQLSKTSGTDAFGAPATIWTVAGKGEVARTASTSSKSYTGVVKGTAIAKDLNLNAANIDATVYTDGKAAGSAVKLDTLDSPALGGNGSTVDVYVTGETTMDIIVTNTYLGTIKSNSYKAEDASKDVKEQVAITLNTDGAKKPAGATATSIVFETGKFTKDDEGKAVLYTAAYDRATDDNATYAIVSAEFPGEVTGVVTRSNATNFVMGGVTYNYGAKSVITRTDVDSLVTAKTETTFYTDGEGNIMGAKDAASTEDVYALILDAALVSTDGWNREARVKLLGTDGKITEAVVTKVVSQAGDGTETEANPINADAPTGPALATALTDIKGDFVKVVEDGSATKVKLYSQVSGTVVNTDGNNSTPAGASSAAIARNTPSLGNGSKGFDAIANAKTVFLYKDAQDNVTAYTGIGNVASAKYQGDTARAVINSNGVAVVVYVPGPVLDPDSTSAQDIVYVAVKSYDTATSADKGTTTVYNAVVNGEITTIEADGTALKVADTGITHATAEDQLLSAVSKKADSDLITNSTELSGEALITRNPGYDSVADGVITINGIAYSYDDDTQVYFVDGEGVITAGAISDLKAAGDVNDKIIGYTVNNVVAALFVTAVEDPTAGDATLTLDHTTLTVKGTSSETLTATFTANTSGLNVSSWSWTSATPAAATVSGSSGTGTVTGVAAGTSVITVTATLDNTATISASCTVTVSAKTEVEASADKNAAEITDGTGTATVTVTCDKDVTVTAQSADETKCTVGVSGKAVTITGVANTTDAVKVTITVTPQNDDANLYTAKTLEVSVTVSGN